jgi:DNA-binding response OmpR family regulator
MANILVLDDDRSLCELLATILSEEGHAVQVAHNLADALALTRQHQPAVVLFDMRLPDGDGAEFVARYRELPAATARLLAVSGITSLGAQAAEIGADGYLPKPFGIDDLLAVVARVLPDPVAPGASA